MPTKHQSSTVRPRATGLQDGLREWLNEQAKSAEANVEKRIEREPFDFRREMKKPLPQK